MPFVEPGDARQLKSAGKTMSEIVATIAPIFFVILLGAALKRIGLVPASFTGPANQIVYFAAIPAMLFRSVSQAPLVEYFQFEVVLGTLLPVLTAMIISLPLVRLLGLSGSKAGSFIQTTYHGNIGYVGFAVAYYFMGDDGLTRAGIVGGFLMIFQNFLSVAVLARARNGNQSGLLRMWISNVLVNPVVLSIMAGLVYSLTGLALPTVLERSLGILGGLALPTALLLIGAGLSLDQIKGQFRAAATAGFVKLLVLPGLGLCGYILLGLETSAYLPGLILLAAPTATVTYVMASELGGDMDFAAAVISITNLASAFTISLWLALTSS